MHNPRFVVHRKVWLWAVLVAGTLLLGAIAVTTRAGIVAAQGPQPQRPQSAPLDSGFTYQGQLKSAGAPVNGSCQLAFRLYDDLGAGNLLGLPISLTVPITAGLFTVVLNDADQFGPNAFNGDARWLEIWVSTTCPASGSFTTLNPRQPLTPAPSARSRPPTKMCSSSPRAAVITTPSAMPWRALPTTPRPTTT